MKQFFSVLLFSLVMGVFIGIVAHPVIGVLFASALFASSFIRKDSGVLGLNNTNNMSARESFMRAKEIFKKAFAANFQTQSGIVDMNACSNFVDGLKLSQSEVRLEVNLSTTNNTFIFGVLNNQSNTNNVQFATEKRLNQSDTLCVNEYGIYVGQANGNNDTTFVLNTYGNTQVFAAADAAALDSTFYSNGAFTINAANDVVAPYRGLFNHWYKPQSQQTAALGAGSPKDQLRGAEDGMITMEPNILLIGSKNYVPQIVLPAAMASAAANLRCVLIMRGILAQNSTVTS